MRIVALTGARGAGKTTVAYAVASLGAARMLKPFTTRKPRSQEDDEYFFLPNRPPTCDAAWCIARGPDFYGMLNSELESVPHGGIGITVFDPVQLDVLFDFRAKNSGSEVIVVGLDTITCEGEQATRTGNEPDRRMSLREIAEVRRKLEDTDVKLAGDCEEIIAAVVTICTVLNSRGGVVPKEQLKPLMVAGSLLVPFVERNLESASYDLRVGDEIWCGGFVDLNKDTSPFDIPPYSYAIVKALEKATMPTFLTAQFDLKVSHFCSGVILSNGPQVDPGYKGDLFCMLFNGSSRPRPLRYSDHFATIQFFTTTKCGQPYTGQYNLRERLRTIMPVEVIGGPGGAIFSKMMEDIDAAKTELRKEMPKDRTGLNLTVLGLVVTIIFGLSGWVLYLAEAAREAVAEARKAVQLLEQERHPVSAVGDREIQSWREEGGPVSTLIERDHPRATGAAPADETLASDPSVDPEAGTTSGALE